MIADVDFVVMTFLLLAWAMFFMLGVKVASYFGILSGIFGLFLAIEIFTVTGSAIASLAWSSISIFTMILGIEGTMRESREG